MSCEPITDPDSPASKQELLWARRDATGQSSRDIEVAIIRTLLPWAMLSAVRDAQSAD